MVQNVIGNQNNTPLVNNARVTLTDPNTGTVDHARAAQPADGDRGRAQSRRLQGDRVRRSGRRRGQHRALEHQPPEHRHDDRAARRPEGRSAERALPDRERDGDQSVRSRHAERHGHAGHRRARSMSRRRRIPATRSTWRRSVRTARTPSPFRPADRSPSRSTPIVMNTVIAGQTLTNAITVPYASQPTCVGQHGLPRRQRRAAQRLRGERDQVADHRSRRSRSTSRSASRRRRSARRSRSRARSASSKASRRWSSSPTSSRPDSRRSAGPSASATWA